jgi:predicted ArsR family transcriptional regulator
MTTWKDILLHISRYGASTPAQVSEALGCSPQHARVLLERCRGYKTLRYAGKEGPSRLYELTEYGRRRVRLRFKRIGEWEVMG